MDTELLRTFLEVSRTRHFGQAAESLYLTQSAVSSRIRQLENQLGTSLFTRHRHNIRLTSAGKRLLPYAENLIATWQMAKKEVTQAPQHTELAIGAIASLWESYLTPWTQMLYQKQETLRLEARIAPRQLLIKQLCERQLDLLITTELPKMDELVNQLVGNFSLQLFCATEHKDKPLKPYINVEWGADFQRQNSKILANEEISLTTTSAHLARHLLETTGGCTFLPTHWGKLFPNLTIVNEATTINRPLYASWLQGNNQQTLIHQLLNIAIT